MDSIKRVLILLFSTLLLVWWLAGSYDFFSSFGERYSSGTLAQGIFIFVIPTMLNIGWSGWLWLGGMRKNNLNMTLLAIFIVVLILYFYIIAFSN